MGMPNCQQNFKYWIHSAHCINFHCSLPPTQPVLSAVVMFLESCIWLKFYRTAFFWTISCIGAMGTINWLVHKPCKILKFFWRMNNRRPKGIIIKTLRREHAVMSPCMKNLLIIPSNWLNNILLKRYKC